MILAYSSKSSDPHFNKRDVGRSTYFGKNQSELKTQARNQLRHSLDDSKPKSSQGPKNRLRNPLALFSPDGLPYGTLTGDAI